MRTENGSASGLISTAMTYPAPYHWLDAAGSAQSTALVRCSGVSAGSLAQWRRSPSTTTTGVGLVGPSVANGDDAPAEQAERPLGMTTAGGLQCVAAGDGFRLGTCRMPGRDHLDPGMPESRPIGVLGALESWPAGLHRPGTTRVSLSGPTVDSCTLT